MPFLAQRVGAHSPPGKLQSSLQVARLLQGGQQFAERRKVPLRQPGPLLKHPIAVVAWQQLSLVQRYCLSQVLRSLRAIAGLPRRLQSRLELGHVGLYGVWAKTDLTAVRAHHRTGRYAGRLQILAQQPQHVPQVDAAAPWINLRPEQLAQVFS